MRALKFIPHDEARRLRGLLFDLDDTFLDNGALTAEAYAALYRARDAGLSRIAVTGRPAGWGEILMMQWPLDAVVTENGAVAWIRRDRGLECIDTVSTKERLERSVRLMRLVQTIREAVPNLPDTSDVWARRSDHTFDIAERYSASGDEIDTAATLAADGGARVLRSSIHLHVTIDRHDKATGTLELLRRTHDVDRTAARAQYAFIGDSENDAAAFAAFHTSIGVANLRGRPSIPPRFICQRPMGAGFVEAVDALIAARG